VGFVVVVATTGVIACGSDDHPVDASSQADNSPITNERDGTSSAAEFATEADLVCGDLGARLDSGFRSLDENSGYLLPFAAALSEFIPVVMELRVELDAIPLPRDPTAVNTPIAGLERTIRYMEDARAAAAREDEPAMAPAVRGLGRTGKQISPLVAELGLTRCGLLGS